MSIAAAGTPTERYFRFVTSRMMGMRTNRYSWWTHWRELADNFLPRRYKWIITPNQQSRGSPLNQHIIDSTGVFAARNLAAGLLSGKSSPTRRWFKLRIGREDTTETTPTTLWLAEVERLMRLVFSSSNFYNSIATFYFDLVIFGTAVIIIYEDYDNVINCYNPCAGEYYVDIDGQYKPCILYREFTMTSQAVVNEFGIENVSQTVRELYERTDGSGLTREIIVAHAIEPNTDDDRGAEISPRFAYREVYWEWGGSASPQAGPQSPPKFLRKRGFMEQPHATVRWDTVSNDPYGRSPAMDGLGDQKQLQLEQRRKAQAIDKMVNPPLVGDAQLKNQPASLLPGGMTYISGFGQAGGVTKAVGSIYDTKFDVGPMMEDIKEVQERLRKVFFNDLFQTASQFETRSNITAVEWDMRKSESMVMLGPVIDRIDNEGLKLIVDRTFGIMSRAGILPPPPPEIANKEIDISFVSMLAQAQEATAAASIERVMGFAGNLAGVDPSVMDNVDVDYALDKYSMLLNNDPKMIRSRDQVAAMRQQRQESQQQMEQAAVAEQLAKGAKTLSETDIASDNVLTRLTGIA